jgi:hypothetical protein
LHRVEFLAAITQIYVDKSNYKNIVT